VLMRSCVGDALGAGVERWFVDVLHVDDCWCWRVDVCWCVDVLMSWCVGCFF
jgi:hypothetical protein